MARILIVTTLTVLFLLNANCCNSKRCLSLNDCKIIQENFSLNEIERLSKFLTYFDTRIIEKTGIDNKDSAYHKFCENLRGSSPTLINKQLQYSKLFNSTINIDFISNPLFYEIWRTVSYKTVEGKNDFKGYELNNKNRFILILKHLTKEYPVLEEYYEIVKSTGDITPSLISGYPHVHNNLDFNDSLVRLWTFIHFATIHLNSEFYLRIPNE